MNYLELFHGNKKSIRICPDCNVCELEYHKKLCSECAEINLRFNNDLAVAKYQLTYKYYQTVKKRRPILVPCGRFVRNRSRKFSCNFILFFCIYFFIKQLSCSLK